MDDQPNRRHQQRQRRCDGVVVADCRIGVAGTRSRINHPLRRLIWMYLRLFEFIRAVAGVQAPVQHHGVTAQLASPRAESIWQLIQASIPQRAPCRKHEAQNAEPKAQQP